MNDAQVLHQTRRILFGLAIGMFGATIVELVLAEHTGGLIQLLPFLCCVLGIAAVGWFWTHPAGRALRRFRVLMFAIAATSVFGIGEHVWNAIQMTRDFHPGIGGFALWKTALTSSVPILAPGALAAGAFVALIGTYGLQPAVVGFPRMNPEAGKAKPLRG